MPFTPRRKNNRRANPQTPQSETKRLDGLWQDGDWWCKLPSLMSLNSSRRSWFPRLISSCPSSVISNPPHIAHLIHIAQSHLISSHLISPHHTSRIKRKQRLQKIRKTFESSIAKWRYVGFYEIDRIRQMNERMKE